MDTPGYSPPSIYRLALLPKLLGIFVLYGSRLYHTFPFLFPPTFPPFQMDQRAIVSAYRHLYRQGLKTMRYSTPGRHVLVQILRSSFRSSPAQEFDQLRIANTLRFLARATDMAGIEHKIMKNLLSVRYWEQPQVNKDMRM